MSDLDLIVCQQMGAAPPRARLTYLRDGAWHDLSERLLFPLSLVRKLRGPATLSLSLDNSDGLLAPDNQASPLNRDAGDHYDPLLDEMRLVRLEQGVRGLANCAAGCAYTCTPPTASRGDAGGELTDGLAADPTDPEAPGWVGWQSAEPVWIQVDLGTIRQVGAVAVRCLSAGAAGVRLPVAGGVQVSAVSAGGPWTAAGSLRREHLADSEAGQAECLALVDLEIPARWVRLTLTPASGAWLQADEVAVYDRAQPQDLLALTFTGYLGDAISQDGDWAGEIRLEQVRDTTKRLADRFIEVYAKYREQPVEAIVADLLTNSRYGLGLSPEAFALEASDFIMPRWTSQNQSILASCVELAGVLGWTFGADAAGVYRFAPLDYSRRSPQRVFAAGWDLLAWRKTASGLQLRNEVLVRSRGSGDREIKVTARDEASIARYGVRTFVMHEDAVKTGRLARQLALSILRDYGRVQQAGAAAVRGDVRLAPGQVVAVHEPAATGSSATGLFRLVQVESEQTGDGCGEMTMHLGLAGYRPAAPGMPQHLLATPGDRQAALNWDDNPEPWCTGYRLYQAEAPEGPFALIAEPALSLHLVTGLDNGTTYWFSVSAVDGEGAESDACGPVACTPNAAGGETGDAADQWRIAGLQAAKATLGGTETARLTWDRPAQGMGKEGLYHIYRSRAEAGPWALVATVTSAGPTETWYDRALGNPSGAYWWRVRYFNGRTGFEGAAGESVTLVW